MTSTMTIKTTMFFFYDDDDDYNDTDIWQMMMGIAMVTVIVMAIGMGVVLVLIMAMLMGVCGSNKCIDVGFPFLFVR